MSKNVDNRIVNMQFNNGEFEKNAQTTLDTLQKLTQSLKLEDVASNVEKVSSKFNIFGAIGFTAIQNLTNSAINFGKDIAAAVLDPLIEGGQKRALNIEQAKFQLRGLGLDVEAVFNLAREAVLGTAFGLDEAAKAAANLGASQVPLEQMGKALRGISGVAALSGSAYADIADVFQKVAGQGRLMGDDLNRLATRGVNAAATLAKAFGTTEEDIRKMVTEGKISFEMFANSMDDAFGAHATKANETYTGALSNMRAAISRIGASFATADFEKQRRIFNAFTPVIDGIAKGLQPVVALYEELASESAAGMENFLSGFAVKNADGVLETRGILQDFINATGPFIQGIRNIRDAVNAFLKPIGDAFKKVFPAKDGPVTVLTDMATAFQKFTEGIKVSSEAASVLQNIFTGLFIIIKIVLSVVWGVIQVVGAVIVVVWKLIEAFFKLLAPIGKFVESLFPVTDGLDKGTDSIQAFFDKVLKLVDILNNNLTKALGNVATGFDTWLNSGGPRQVVIDIANAFVALGQAIADVWRIIFSGDFAGNPLFDEKSKFAEFLYRVRDVLSDIAGHFVSFFSGIAKAFRDFFGAIGQGLQEGVENINWGVIIAGLLAALNGMVIFEVVRFINIIIRQILSFIAPIAKISGSFVGILDNVTGVLTAMQLNIKAEALLKIAAALLVLAIALNILSNIPAEKLLASTIALGVGLAAMMKSLMIINGLSVGGFAKLPLVTGAMIMLGNALLLLSVSVLILGNMPLDKLLAGVGAVVVLLASLVATAIVLSKFVDKILIASIGISAIATALGLLIVPVLALAFIPMGALAQGIGAVLGMLIGLVGVAIIFGKFQKNIFMAAAGINLLATALNLLIVPVLALAFIPINNLIQGIAGVGAMLLILVGAALLLGTLWKQIVFASAALVALAFAVNLLIVPIVALAFLPLDNLIQGMAAVGIAIVGLAATAILMGLAGPALIVGAAAMLMMGAALWLLAPPIALLAVIPFDSLIATVVSMGIALLALSAFALLAAPGLLLVAPALIIFGVALLAIAVSFAVFTAAVLVLTPALMTFGFALGDFAKLLPDLAEYIPAILGLGAAFIVFGAGALVAGIGIMALSAGLMGLSVAMLMIDKFGSKGVEALTTLLLAIAGMGIHILAIMAMSVAFVALGAAMLVLGAGVMVLGAGIVVLGAGLVLISAMGATGALALATLLEKLAMLAVHIPVALALTVALLAFGVAIAAVGVGLVVFAAGAALAGLGLMALGGLGGTATSSILMLSQALMILLPVVLALIPMAAVVLALAAAIGILAIAAAAAAIAILVLAPGMLMLGAGLLMVVTALRLFGSVGEGSIAIMAKLLSTIVDFVWHVGSILAVAAAIVVLGAGVLLLGAGLVVFTAGTMLAVAALALLLPLGNTVTVAMTKLVEALSLLVAFTPQLMIAVMALVTFGTSLGVASVGAISTALALLAIIAAMNSTTNAAKAAGIAIATMFTSAGSVIPSYLAKLDAASEGTKAFAVSLVLTLMNLDRDIKKSGNNLNATMQALALGVIMSLITTLRTGQSSLYEEGRQTGEYVAMGMARGLQNGSYLVSLAAMNVARDALNASKKALGIASPSKEGYKLGMWYDKGIANGMTNYSGLASDAAKTVAVESIDAMRDTLSRIGEVINSDVDTTPRITPILDLSNVKHSIGELDGYFGDTPLNLDSNRRNATAVLEARNALAEATANSTPESSGDIIFNQTNNSPKAISSGEQYRMTNNLINSAKGAINNAGKARS